jgi:hypothetical protein
MENEVKSKFLESIALRLGKPQKFGNSRSLFKIEGSDVRLYLRYSKIHARNEAFYGLRDKDLKQIEGFPSYICLLWEGQQEPLIIPFAEYEDVFQSATPADDGQYKVLVFVQKEGTELYIPKAGRFNVEGYFGWTQIEKIINTKDKPPIPGFSHSQIQTLLGAIGTAKDFDVWIPPIDRSKLDWSISHQFNQRDNLPHGFEKVSHILSEIDVIWLQRGGNTVQGLFEVEHSTSIYSGLLRFNDIHLVAPNLKARFSIVANNERRSRFVRQISRPTFQSSGLDELCTFLEYSDVYNWHQRIGGTNA